MLIHRLVEYAERPESNLPPLYYRPKQIHWILAVDERGEGGWLVDRRPAKGTGDQPLIVNAPYAYRSGKKPPPCLLVDTAQYVLGVPKPDLPGGRSSAKAEEEALRRNREYADLIRAWADSAPDEPLAQAMRRYVSANGLRSLSLPEDLGHGDNVAVMISGQWLHDLPSAQRMWAEIVRGRKGGAREICLVCGEKGDLLATIPESIKSGAIPTSGRGKDAQLISINKAAQGRGGVIQLANTPVCERCGSRAMAALNSLLADPAHRRRDSESVTVWWTREPIEDDLPGMLDEPTPEAVGRLLDSLQHRPDPIAAEVVDANAYYALTLGVNNARVVVRDWLDIPLPRLRANIARWFRVHGVFDGWSSTYQYLPIWRLAASTGRWDPKAKKYAPKTAFHGVDTALRRAAMHRTPLPAQLLPHLLQRIRADHRLDAPRIALLQLLVNPPAEGETTTMPAPETLGENPDGPFQSNPSQAYLCGRAFAVLESIQRTALPDLNATIGDKYFGTAMTAPAAVFTNLHRGAKAHLKRLRRDRRGTSVALERKLTDAFAAIERFGPIPTMLTMREQADFVLGYERQRAEDNAARAEYKAKKEQEKGEEDLQDD